MEIYQRVISVIFSGRLPDYVDSVKALYVKALDIVHVAFKAVDEHHHVFASEIRNLGGDRVIISPRNPTEQIAGFHSSTFHFIINRDNCPVTFLLDVLMGYHNFVQLHIGQ